MEDKNDLPCGSLTLSHLQSIEKKLAAAAGDELVVEYYPDSPATYRLNKATAALLVGYAKSNYGNHDDIGAVMVERDMTFTISVVSRHLHERHGIVPLVDWVISQLNGFTPANCTKPLRVVNDRFENHERGLWFHAVDMKTQGVAVQDCNYNPEPLL